MGPTDEHNDGGGINLIFILNRSMHMASKLEAANVVSYKLINLYCISRFSFFTTFGARIAVNGKIIVYFLYRKIDMYKGRKKN